MPRPIISPAETFSQSGFGAHAISDEAGGIDDTAAGEHAARAVAVGDRAGDRLADAPHDVLDGDRQREDLAAPAARLRHRREEQPHDRARPEREQRDQAAGDDHDREGDGD